MVFGATVGGARNVVPERPLWGKPAYSGALNSQAASALAGLFNSFWMIRRPDPVASNAAEGMAIS
jgi:hypothetical protein